MNIDINPEGLPDFLFALFLLGALLFVYLLPTIIARLNKKKKIGLTLLLNVLIGWTAIGWMVLLVLAFGRDEK